MDHTYKITEIVGSSPDGIDDAIRNGIGRAAKTLRNLDWFEVTDIRGAMNDGDDRVVPGDDEGRVPPRRRRLTADCHRATQRGRTCRAPSPRTRCRCSPRARRTAWAPSAPPGTWSGRRCRRTSYVNLRVRRLHQRRGGELLARLLHRGEEEVGRPVARRSPTGRSDRPGAIFCTSATSCAIAGFVAALSTGAVCVITIDADRGGHEVGAVHRSGW